jgi:hypothetical protein
MLAAGGTLAQVAARFPTPLITTDEKQKPSSKNSVLPKGSTLQISAMPESAEAPMTTIDASSATPQAAMAVHPQSATLVP